MAKLDLIDRTALVAELEELKVILGDVFLGMVVERVIERVEKQPRVDLPRMELHSDRVIFYDAPDRKREILFENL